MISEMDSDDHASEADSGAVHGQFRLGNTLLFVALTARYTKVYYTRQERITSRTGSIHQSSCGKRTRAPSFWHYQLVVFAQDRFVPHPISAQCNPALSAGTAAQSLHRSGEVHAKFLPVFYRYCCLSYLDLQRCVIHPIFHLVAGQQKCTSL